MLKPETLLYAKRQLPLTLRSLLTATPNATPNGDWGSLARRSSTRARQLIDYEQAKRLSVLPLALSECGQSPRLSIACGEADVGQLLLEVKFAAGVEVDAELAESSAIRKAIDAAYLGDEAVLLETVERVKALSEGKVALTVTGEQVATSTQPIPALLHTILARGAAKLASDIHLDYRNKCLSVRYRIDGLLRADSELTLRSETAQDIFRRAKILSNVDITKAAQPQDGGFQFKTEGLDFRIRASFVPQLDGEKLVLRLLDNDAPKNDSSDIYAGLAKLGLSSEQQKLFLTYLGAESGVLLLSGPTGSGKSTLLYESLRYLNQEWRNIVTVEDPVERRLPGLTQIEVQRARNLDYACLLPSILRQDPDIIMIGEIRDRETADTALQASVTGHLVLSTIHARNCLEIIPRLLRLGVDIGLLASACRLLVSQRLLPANCVSCLERLVPNNSLTQIFQLPESSVVAASKGCTVCNQTGVAGRKAVFEFLPITEHMSQVLLNNSESFEAEAFQRGYRPLRHAIREALINQQIAPSTALKAIGIAPEVVCY